MVATWTDSSGNYSNAASWSTLAAPSNGGGTYYNAVINGTGADTVTFDANGTVVNSLTIGNGETFKDNGLAPTLTVGDPTFPAAGSITNNGTITWGSGSTLTLDITAGNGSITNNGTINLTGSRLRFDDSGNGNTLTLSGGGTINASGASIIGNTTFINNGSTIEGSVFIQADNVINTAGGIIDANGAGQTIGLPLVNLTNTGGTLEATNGGLLALDYTHEINNKNGVIASIGAGSVVNFNSGSRIDGGTLTTAGGGILGPLNSAGFGIFLDGSTQGPLTLSTGSTWTSTTASTNFLGGTYINNGNMLFGGGLPSGVIYASMLISGDTVLQGAGTVTLTPNNSGVATIGASGSVTLTNQSIIQGAGTIGGGSALALINQGLIDANVSGQTLTLSPTSSQNAGTLQVESGSTMSLNIGSGSVTNTGTFNVKTGGTMILDVTAGSGTLTNRGTINLAGSTLAISSGGNQNSATLSGGGVVNLIGGTITGSSGSEVLINNDNTIQGAGTISAQRFENYGTINANGLTPLTINGLLLNRISEQNILGAVNVTGPGGLIANGGITNEGLISINNSNFVTAGYSSGLSSASLLQLQNGSTGTITGDVRGFDVGGQILIANSSLSVVGTFGMYNTTVNQGTLRIQGNVDQPDGGQLVLQAGSSAIVTGFFGGFGDKTVIDNSSLVVQGSHFLGDRFGSTNLSNGAILSVSGDLDLSSAFAFNVNSGSSVLVGGNFANMNSPVSLNNSTLQVAGTFANTEFGRVTVGPNGLLTTSNYTQLDTSSSSGTYFTDVSGTLITKSYQQGTGTTTIESGGLIRANTFQATGGTVTVNGILDPTAVEIDSGATLQGTGTIIGNVGMGGTLMPGVPGAPGTLTILGNYEQFGNGTFDEQIGVHSSAFFNITGDAALDFNSLLTITLLDGYDPLGQTFSIMDYGSLVGQFSNGSSFWQDGFLWDISYGQHEIEVTAVSAPEPSSLLLLVLGLAALAFCVHKKMLTASHLA